MNAEKFWYGWLKFAAILCTLFGIFMAFFNRTSLFTILNQHIENAFYINPQFGNEVSSLQGWLISLLGATLAGWGISILFLILYPLQKKELWSWNALILSLVVWFSIDTLLSSHYGAVFNVIINIILALQFIAPLLFIRNSMQPRKIEMDE